MDNLTNIESPDFDVPVCSVLNWLTSWFRYKDHLQLFNSAWVLLSFPIQKLNLIFSLFKY
jgi:hypothetical protein